MIDYLCGWHVRTTRERQAWEMRGGSYRGRGVFLHVWSIIERFFFFFFFEKTTIVCHLLGIGGKWLNSNDGYIFLIKARWLRSYCFSTCLSILFTAGERIFQYVCTAAVRTHLSRVMKNSFVYPAQPFQLFKQSTFQRPPTCTGLWTKKEELARWQQNATGRHVLVPFRAEIFRDIHKKRVQVCVLWILYIVSVSKCALLRSKFFLP